MIMTLYVRPLNRRLLARGRRQCAVRLPPLRCDYLSMDRRNAMLMMILESSRLLCFELALVERAKRSRQRQSKHVAADELRQVHACAMRIEFCAGGTKGALQGRRSLGKTDSPIWSRECSVFKKGSELFWMGLGWRQAKTKARARLPLVCDELLDESQDDAAGLVAAEAGSQGHAARAREEERPGGSSREGGGQQRRCAGELVQRRALEDGGLPEAPWHPSIVARASIEALMMEDFVGAQTGPHQDERRLTVRGWLEHRSHLQSYAGPIRQGWTPCHHRRPDKLRLHRASEGNCSAGYRGSRSERDRSRSERDRLGTGSWRPSSRWRLLLLLQASSGPEC